MSRLRCHILFFSLTLECADEEGMRYRSVMSSLLQEYGGVGIFVTAQISYSIFQFNIRVC